MFLKRQLFLKVFHFRKDMREYKAGKISHPIGKRYNFCKWQFGFDIYEINKQKF